MTLHETVRTRSGTVRYETPHQRVEIGNGVVERLEEIVTELGAGVVGVLASNRNWRGPLGQRVALGLDALEAVVSNEVVPHNPLPEAVRIGREFAASGVRVIVSVGGGSASDLGKAVAAVMTSVRAGTEEVDLGRYFARIRNDGSVADHTMAGQPVPLVAVPTTLSGAELTPGAGVTEHGMKRVLWDQALAARAVLYETSSLNELPDSIVATTGMNAVAHAVEATYSSMGNGIGDALALAGLERLAAGLLRYLAIGDRSEQAKTEMFTGAVLAGRALCVARVCLHHAICHVLGAHHGVPHGAANAAMLSHVVDLNEAGAAQPLALVAASMQSAAGSVLGTTFPASAPGAILREFESRIGAPTTLGQIGLTTVDVEGVVAGLREERGLAFNPVPVTDDDIRNLLQRATGAAP